MKRTKVRHLGNNNHGGRSAQDTESAAGAGEPADDEEAISTKKDTMAAEAEAIFEKDVKVMAAEAGGWKRRKKKPKTPPLLDPGGHADEIFNAFKGEPKPAPQLHGGLISIGSARWEYLRYYSLCGAFVHVFAFVLFCGTVISMIDVSQHAEMVNLATQRELSYEYGGDGKTYADITNTDDLYDWMAIAFMKRYAQDDFQSGSASAGCAGINSRYRVIPAILAQRRLDFPPVCGSPGLSLIETDGFSEWCARAHAGPAKSWFNATGYVREDVASIEGFMPCRALDKDPERPSAISVVADNLPFFCRLNDGLDVPYMAPGEHAARTVQDLRALQVRDKHVVAHEFGARMSPPVYVAGYVRGRTAAGSCHFLVGGGL